ncbi:SRPBCC family protein [Paenibacillus sp. JDR-2]|uniref:SRPBCC family protein n=1 Tax=Paenibacillus sp. (strain JDR-2) TaxID=324057 RepID=UPI0001668D0D|nr:SRPBCC domain-containing protein [Paenibacillus sp. JDR-2]ACT03254.1 Activator of Hsp90 ATPase 1 family protein [Paenibacillus sp. JDR-2]
MGYSEKIVGKTASVGFQIGVRRTLPVSPETAWTFLTSAKGLKLWIGNVKDISIEAGETFQSTEGISGELRIVKPLQQLRLKWSKPGWEKPSTLQIRLISSHPGKTTVSFHQENLDHAATREQMKLHWEDVLNDMLQITKAN